MKYGQNGPKCPKNEVFATFLKNASYDFSQNLTKSVELCILAMFQKLAQNNAFQRSYDVKCGKKRQKIDVKTEKFDKYPFFQHPLRAFQKEEMQLAQMRSQPEQACFWSPVENRRDLLVSPPCVRACVRSGHSSVTAPTIFLKLGMMLGVNRATKMA